MTLNKKRRVAFIAHALAPGYLSTDLISQRLTELGKTWPDIESGENPGFIKWFSTEFQAPTGVEGVESVVMDFYIIPVFATPFLKAVYAGKAYKWTEAVALHAINEACEADEELYLGWGALTKNATNHGELFLQRNKALCERCDVHTTHGDAGTAALVLKALHNIQLSRGSRVAVVGANGVIGRAVAMMLPQYHVEEITLVGRSDKLGETKKLDRLLSLKAEVEKSCKRYANGTCTRVTISQDHTCAALDNESNVVVMSTIGVEIKPEQVPHGTVIVDLTTPASCNTEKDWHGRIPFTAGCGIIPKEMMPKGFAMGSKHLFDVGAAVTSLGGERVLWGCALETIVRAMYGRKGHISGHEIDPKETVWAYKAFKKLDIKPQSPVSLGKKISSWMLLQTVVNIHALQSMRPEEFNVVLEVFASDSTTKAVIYAVK